MNLRPTVKYQLLDSKIAVPVFYGFILVLMGLLTISASSAPSSAHISLSGFDLATIIFLFIMGLNSFRETFHFLTQNGIARKTMFTGFIITSSILALAMSAINEVFLLIGKTLMSNYPNFVFQSLFEQIYQRNHSVGTLTATGIAEEILFITLLSFGAIVFGFFITIMYYRLSKVGKIAVSIGVPATFIFVIPILDAMVTGGQIHRFMGQFVLFTFGIKNGLNPTYAMISSIMFAAIFLFFTWLMIRRVPVKN